MAFRLWQPTAMASALGLATVTATIVATVCKLQTRHGSMASLKGGASGAKHVQLGGVSRARSNVELRA